MVKRTGVTISNWVWDEILSKAENRSALIEEALIKLHYDKTNQKLNKEPVKKEELLDNGLVV